MRFLHERIKPFFLASSPSLYLLFHHLVSIWGKVFSILCHCQLGFSSVRASAHPHGQFKVYSKTRTWFQDISSNFWWTKAMAWEMECQTQMLLNCQQRSKRVLLVFCSLCLVAEVCLGLMRSARAHTDGDKHTENTPTHFSTKSGPHLTWSNKPLHHLQEYHLI